MAMSSRAVLVSLLALTLLHSQVAAGGESTGKQDERIQDDFVLAVHCGRPGNPTKVADLRRTIEQLDSSLPNIPPDEAKYLEKEEAAVMSLGSLDKLSADDKRIAALRILSLRSRRLYFAWKIRANLARAQVAVNAIDDPDHIPAIAAEDFLSVWSPRRGVDAQTWPNPVHNAQADRIYRMVGVLAPVADLASAMSEFLSNEEKHQDQLLTEQQRLDSRLAPLALSYDLEGALSCDFLKYALERR